MSDSLLDKLNEEQRKAAETIEGPVLALAGAGTGKTRVITFRIAHMIRSGVLPGQILGVTFTNKAAREMRERLASLVAPETASKVTLCTFHSFCVRLLRREISPLGFTSNFTIADEGDQDSILKQAAAELGYTKDNYRKGAVAAIISKAKNELVTPDEFPGSQVLGRGPKRRPGNLRKIPAAASKPERLGLRRSDDVCVYSFHKIHSCFGKVSGYLPLFARGRVSGHQPRAVSAFEAPRRRAPEPLRGGRRRPEHLQLARGRHLPTSSISRTSSETSKSSSLSAITAPPIRSSTPPTSSSTATRSAMKKISGPAAATATISA